MSSKRTLSFTAVIVVLAGLCLAGGALVWRNLSNTGSASEDAVPIGGPFSLTDHTGKPVTEKSWPGKHLLVYFGYSFCPDVCPGDLQNMALALTTLEKSRPAAAAKIQPLFITIDPERDTQQALKSYVGLFHPRLVGLTGSAEQIERAKQSYRVYAVKREDGSSSDYLMDHSALVYLISPEGKYEAHFTSNTPPADMAKRIAELIG